MKPTVCGTLRRSWILVVGGAGGTSTSGRATPGHRRAGGGGQLAGAGVAGVGVLGQAVGDDGVEPGGIPGAGEDGGGTSVFRWAYISAARPSPVNGRRPVRHSNSTQASE